MRVLLLFFFPVMCSAQWTVAEAEALLAAFDRSDPGHVRISKVVQADSSSASDLYTAGSAAEDDW